MKGYEIGQYPINYQAAYTFIITDDSGRFGRFSVSDEKRSYSSLKQVIEISPDGSALLEMESIWDLDSSIGQRNSMKAMDEETKKRFYQMLDAYIASGGEMLERRIEGLERKYGTIKSYTKLRKKDAYQVTGDMIVIDIPGYGRETSFTEKERKNPIFYSGNSLEESVTIYRIPRGLRIAYIPENLNMDIGFFNVKREFLRKKNEIIVTQIDRYMRLELPRESYVKVKDFFDRLPARTAQRIVLKKIKPGWQGIKDLLERFRKAK